MIQLEDSIASQPHDPSNYIKLIELLREECDEESSVKLENYRNTYCHLFCTSKEFWRDWITDKLCIKSITFNEIEEFFKFAIKIYPHIDIVSDLIDYVLDQYEKDRIVDQDVYRIFEYSIGICGIDYNDGGLIWKRYREFVTDEYNDLLKDEENEIEEIDIYNSKENIIKVYLRQLSLPLKDNPQCLHELEILLGKICVESDISLIKPELFQEKYSTSCAQSSKIIVYENLISKLTGKNINGKVLFDEKLMDFYQIWKVYINYELNVNQNLIRAQRLYERAILENPECVTLWQEYVEFAAYTLQNWSLVECVTNRGLILYKSNFILWNLRLLSLENIYLSDQTSQNQSVNDNNVIKAIDTALFSAFETIEEYMSILLYSCDFRRRRLAKLKLNPNNVNDINEGILSLRNCFENAKKYMIAYFPGYEEAYLKLIKYHIQCEETLIRDIIGTPPKAEYSGLYINEKDIISIWENVISIFPKSCYSWLEYILWCKGKNDEHCRGLFSKATANVVDHTEIICREWIKFEQQYGNFNDLVVATLKTKLILPKIVHGSENTNTNTNVKTDTDAKVGNNKKVKFNEYSSSNNNSNELHNSHDNSVKKRTKHSNQNEDKSTDTVTNEEENNGANNTESKVLTRDQFTVFVTKFSDILDEDGLKILFSAAGDIVGVKVFRDKNTGVSQCKGLVQFSTTEAKNNALKLSQTIVDGHKITVLTSKFPCLLNTADKIDEIKGNNNDNNKNNSEISGLPTTIKSKTSVLAFKPRSMKIKI